MLNAPAQQRTNGTMSGHWTTRDSERRPLAHHRVHGDSRILATGLSTLTPDSCIRWLLAAAAQHDLEWSSETWPTLIRPDSASGRALDARAIQAGLLLIQRASDPSGTLVLLETTLPTRVATTALLDSLVVGTGEASP